MKTKIATKKKQYSRFPSYKWIVLQTVYEENFVKIPVDFI